MSILRRARAFFQRHYVATPLGFCAVGIGGLLAMGGYGYALYYGALLSAAVMMMLLDLLIDP